MRRDIKPIDRLAIYTSLPFEVVKRLVGKDEEETEYLIKLVKDWYDSQLFGDSIIRACHDKLGMSFCAIAGGLNYRSTMRCKGKWTAQTVKLEYKKQKEGASSTAGGKGPPLKTTA